MKKALSIVFLLLAFFGVQAQDQEIGSKDNIVRVLGRFAIDTVLYDANAGDNILFQSPDGTIKKTKIPQIGGTTSFDSIVITPTTMCIYAESVAYCYDFTKFIVGLQNNLEETKVYGINLNGDSIGTAARLPHDYLKQGVGISLVRVADTVTMNATGTVIATPITWAVLDVISDPIMTAVDGTKYLVSPTPTGIFVGHANDIATFVDASDTYTFEDANVGDMLYNATTAFTYQWTGTVWEQQGRANLHQGGDDAGYGEIVVGSTAGNNTRVLNGLVNNADTVTSAFNVLTLDINNRVRRTALPTFTIPNLQQVTDVGNRTTNPIFVDSIQIWQGAGSISTNTAIGKNVLLNTLPAGIWNTAIGDSAMTTNSSGAYNTAVGTNTLTYNTTGSANTAYGVNALKFNTTALLNTAVGQAALQATTTGGNNTALGANALLANLTGDYHVAIGSSAMAKNTGGTSNVGIGRTALFNNTTGQRNTAVGAQVMTTNTIGEYNVAVGSTALFKNSTGNHNTALGPKAMYESLNIDSSVAVGAGTMYGNSGSGNTAVGAAAMYYTISGGATGKRNTALGYAVLQQLNTGSFNTVVGAYSGNGITTGEYNTIIGAQVTGAICGSIQ
jgi:hypothetical protein